MSSEKCNEILGRPSSTLSYRSGKAASVYIPSLTPLFHSDQQENAPRKPPIHFINSYSPHPRYRRDSVDFKISEKRPSTAGADTIMSGAAPAIPPRRLPGERPFFKTYDIRSTSDSSFKNIEICQNGRPIIWVAMKAKTFGSPVISLCSGGPDGPELAACKFKSIRSGFYIRVSGGNNSTHLTSLDNDRWPHQVSWTFSEKDYFFSFQGRRFSWRSPLKGAMSYVKEPNDYHLVDLENGAVLAAYVKDRQWFAFKPIARIDFYVDLGQGLELMALAAIMGIGERGRRRRSAAVVGAV